MLDYLRIVLAARIDRDEKGASAVEYGLLIAGIAALVVVIVFALGGTITGIFTETCTAVATGGGGAAPTGTNCTP